jgi:hypothetical protein
MDGRSTDTRSILNRLASVQAGQEQMQKDVDKLRAGMAAVLTCFAYTVALAALVIFYLRKVAS